MVSNPEAQHGYLNGHAAGIILRESVRRAMTVIRAERAAFEITHKADYEGGMTDVFTTADRKAQDIYEDVLGKCFPRYDIITEEGEPHGELAGPGYFTIDPLDGTKAFIRRQSHGVGTMLAMVENDNVISAYVGDINTQEIYGYRPSSPNVHRITEFETAEPLGWAKRPLAEQYVLLRDPPEVYAEASRAILPAFKSYEVEGGSIGIWLARLWKREVGAALIPPGMETPWDSTPIRGITAIRFP
jgi:hypothetical protein